MKVQIKEYLKENNDNQSGYSSIEVIEFNNDEECENEEIEYFESCSSEDVEVNIVNERILQLETENEKMKNQIVQLCVFIDKLKEKLKRVNEIKKQTRKETNKSKYENDPYYKSINKHFKSLSFSFF